MKLKNTFSIFVTCCLVFVFVSGCSKDDKRDSFAKKTIRNHEILNYRIDGPVQFVNQQVAFLFAMLQSESGIPMVVSPELTDKRVTFSLTNPTVGEILEIHRSIQLFDYEVKEINGDAILFVYEFGKRPKTEFKFPNYPNFKPVKNHPILQKRIQGPVQFVNQDLDFLISMLNSELGVTINRMFQRKHNVTFNLMNPTLQQLLNSVTFQNNMAFQVGTTDNGVEVRLYDVNNL
jgi:hypothetical protein